jgi:hypothetical protein
MIAHRNAYATMIATRGHFDGGADGRELAGIRQQVRHHLQEAAGIHQHTGIAQRLGNREVHVERLREAGVLFE